MLLVAINRRNEIIPELLKILEHTIKNIHELHKDPDYFAPTYALFLLAQFREPKAYPLVIQLFSKPITFLDSLFDDIITEDLPGILASVYNGNIDLIKNLIENRKVNEYVRGSCLRALVAMVLNNLLERKEVVSYFKSLYQGKLERNYSHVWNALVSCSCDLYPEELMKNIDGAFQDNFVAQSFIGRPDIDRALKRGLNAQLEHSSKKRQYELVDNVIAQMNWWACFQPRKQEKVKPKKEPKIFLEKPSPKSVLPSRIRDKTGKKIGRNDPCPCKSGKKYKKCCGAPIRK